MSRLFEQGLADEEVRRSREWRSLELRILQRGFEDEILKLCAFTLRRYNCARKQCEFADTIADEGIKMVISSALSW